MSLVSSTNSGITLNTTSGAVNVSATVPSGTYTLTYNLCDAANATNCATGTVTITVSTPTIVATADSGTVVNGVGGTAVINVRSNDTYNGAGATTTNTVLSFVSSTNAGITLNTTTGTVSVAATVPAGTYTLVYKLCPACGTTNCLNGTVTITVNAQIIDAINNDFTTTPFSQLTLSNTPSVLNNDTLNGVIVNPAAVTTTLVNNGGIVGATINSSGVITIPATVTAGLYTLTYKICQTSNPTNCDTATVTISIINIITPTLVFAKRANNLVCNVEFQSSGKALIGGYFTKYNSVSTPYGFIRLNTDLTIDTSFNTPLNINETDFKVFSDNKILFIGGNSSEMFKVFKLNSDGTIDTNFNSNNNVFTNPYRNCRSFTCGIQSDNKVLVGIFGIENNFNGVPVKCVVRLLPNGTLDTSFNFPYDTVGVNYLGAGIRKIVVLSDDSILVAGTLNPMRNGQPNFFKLDRSGNIFPNFTVGRTNTNPNTGAQDIINCVSCYAQIENIIVQPDGKILLMGVFDSYNGNSNYKNIVRLDADGKIDLTFNRLGTSANRVVKTAVVEPSGKIIIGGEFTSFDGRVVNKMVRLNTNGSLDTSFITGSGTEYNNPPSGECPFCYNNIWELKKQNDGKIVIAGSFISYDGISATNITRISPVTCVQVKNGNEYYEAEREIDINQNNNIFVYPNPSSGLFTIDLTGVSEKFDQIEVYNILGEIVKRQTIIPNENNELSLTEMPSGYYIARLSNENDSVQVKLIKK